MAKKTFFYKTKKGKIIALEEQEAYDVGRFYELIGVSDGKTYENMITPLKLEMNQLQTRMNEYLTANKTVPDDLYQKFTDARIKFNQICNEAFEAELEVAKQKKEKPRDIGNWTTLDNQQIEKPNWLK